MKRNPDSVTVPEWATMQPLACIGGPFDGQWFTGPEWEHRLRAAKRMEDATAGKVIMYARRAGKSTKIKQQAILSYVPSGKKFQHPMHPTVFGDAWIYRERR